MSKHWEHAGWLVRSPLNPRVFVPQLSGMQHADTCAAGGINAVKRYARDWLQKQGDPVTVRFVPAGDSFDVEYTKAWG